MARLNLFTVSGAFFTLNCEFLGLTVSNKSNHPSSDSYQPIEDWVLLKGYQRLLLSNYNTSAWAQFVSFIRGEVWLHYQLPGPMRLMELQPLPSIPPKRMRQVLRWEWASESTICWIISTDNMLPTFWWDKFHDLGHSIPDKYFETKWVFLDPVEDYS